MRTIAENSNDFAELRTLDRGNCVYVDKTDYFHRLVTEDVQSQGRADMVVKARRAIYIIELKRDETAAAALAQIHEKDYAVSYRARNLPIWAIGLNFDSKTRQLTDAVHERL